MSEQSIPIIKDEKTGSEVYVSKRILEQRYLIPISRIKDFFDNLKDGKVTATKCKSCGTIYFPPKADCDRCMSSSMEYIELKGEATLVSFTVVRVKPSTFSSFADYAVGIGRMAEGINILAWIDEDLSRIRIGAKMRLVVMSRKVDNTISYFFKILGHE
ncbi:MAG: Zn-ribbon domain-containing OB-fold protein [Conexivisphaerales archaeon]